MDFKGQKKSEKLSQRMLVAFAVVAFLVGYAKSNFGLMMSLYGLGLLVTFLVTVPNWPLFNKNPIQWKAVGKNMSKSKQQQSFFDQVAQLFK